MCNCWCYCLLAVLLDYLCSVLVDFCVLLAYTGLPVGYYLYNIVLILCSTGT